MKTLLTTFVVFGLTSGMALADADTAIKERQAAMKAVGQAAKAGDMAGVSKAATEAKAAFLMPTAGKGTMETKALDKIWGDGADGFNALMDELIKASAAGDKAAFGTCKACHKDYRS
jgi:cytochrome c556